MGQAFSERSLGRRLLTGQRPDLLIVDLVSGGTEEEEERQREAEGLVLEILLGNPDNEILVLVERASIDLIGDLLRGAAGNLFDATDLDPGGPVRATEERLQDQVLRLARLNVEREAYRQQKRLRRAPPLPSVRRRVFLGHNTADLALSYGLRRFLERNGTRVWYSFREAVMARRRTEWLEPTKRAIGGASVFVPLLSEGWLGSRYCRSELLLFQRAAEKDPSLRVLPIFADGEARRQFDRKSSWLKRHLGSGWFAPMAGASIGAQASWLAEQLARPS